MIRRLFSTVITQSKVIKSQNRLYTSAASIAHAAVDQDMSLPSVADKIVKVTFVDRDGKRYTVNGYAGQTLIEVAREHEIQLQPDPTCAENNGCTNCHVIVSNEFYNTFPQPSEDENEMLQYANGLAENSRLGCQLVLEEDMSGLVVSLPPESITSVSVDSFFRV